MSTQHLIIYAMIWLFVIFVAIFFLVSKKHSSFNIKHLLLYVLIMTMLGPIGEILVGTLYNFLFGHPLWLYRVFPTHEGYTSYYAPVIWAVSGAGIYITHEMIGLLKAKGTFVRALYMMFNSIIFESLLISISFLLITGSYLFYYTPGDLLHLSSLQTLPVYFIFWLIFPKFVEQSKKEPLLSASMFALIAFVVVFLTH